MLLYPLDDGGEKVVCGVSSEIAKLRYFLTPLGGSEASESERNWRCRVRYSVASVRNRGVGSFLEFLGVS